MAQFLPYQSQNVYWTKIPEVVLATLVSKFTFAPSDKNIYWNVAGIQYPTVGMSARPEMPMKVAFVKSSS